MGDWGGGILQSKGADIYRMKCVLSIADTEQKFVYQAVHMIFNGDFDECWAEGEPRQSKLVFIGKNLDHDELKAAFAACASSDELRKKKLKNLRFGVGDSVACNTGGSFQKGTVISLMYRGGHAAGHGRAVPGEARQRKPHLRAGRRRPVRAQGLRPRCFASSCRRAAHRADCRALRP